MSVLAIAGSPSHPSRTYSVLEYAKQHLEAERVSTTLFSVRDLPAEALLFAQFDNPAVKEAIALVEQASAIIISTPVYKAAYTGVLKAFLDLLPQNALVGKPILPIATGGTIAHLLSIDYALKPVLSTLGARHIFAGVYIVDSQIQRLPDGGFQFAEEVEQRLQISLNELIASLQPTQALVSSAS
ncbi:NADPH-dependent FMN reductase [Oculatella sp. FACHB-28]|uniref:NADPH-dependent FMN reductase n=1 Tax=Cyanophyceae TaxID=3028117 RepID=UPI0016867CB2|nr:MULTISPECIES: NADPH-dependent FMN reductase [Cyanophyceae]MBD2000375.1 NADPH-dependent FMN reductase [Leptolyngbya sp. FACHB-541]MBD2058019.1 NADPH-dependent FMN reductase [Oculatella sp. FACHB-28]MBD2068450.1 NADPH-dependent FMN reductase [Leptolyngbya sp. FACHB-671]